MTNKFRENRDADRDAREAMDQLERELYPDGRKTYQEVRETLRSPVSLPANPKSEYRSYGGWEALGHLFIGLPFSLLAIFITLYVIWRVLS
jgi:hypothetical protein